MTRLIYRSYNIPCVDVLDGYNGTVFAYGQTGSGKTFTMMVWQLYRYITHYAPLTGYEGRRH